MALTRFGLILVFVTDMAAVVTVDYGKRVYSIETMCKISMHHDVVRLGNETHPDFFEYNAIWDTGAVRSVISPKVVADLGLQPRGKVAMYHANGVSYVNTYFVNLLLPNKMEVQILQVMDGNLPDADILLGMDVIGLGDFALTAPEGKTLFSFSQPSQFAIDFNKA